LDQQFQSLRPLGAERSLELDSTGCIGLEEADIPPFAAQVIDGV
jgi:hypothetical protein